MITTMLTALAVIQIPKPQFSFRDEAIFTADYVGIVKYIGPEGSYESFYGDNQSLPNIVFRHRFQEIICLKGHSPTSFIALRPNDRGGSDPGVELSAGDISLIYLYKPNSQRRICTGIGDAYLTTESTDQYFQGGNSNPARVTPGTYAPRGSNVLEKCAYVFAISFSRSKDLASLGKIATVCPKSFEGALEFYPSFKAFYRSELLPILDGAIGSDLKLKAYVLASHYLVLRENYLAEFKALVHRLDREWPNQDDADTFCMGVGDRDFFLSLLDARMPSLRAAAVACLPMELTYQDRIIRKLSDTSKKVRKEAIVWLWQLSLNKNVRPPAPVPEWEHGDCKNEAAIREYWGG